MTEGNKGKVTITKSGDKYYGTFVWTNVSDALDKNNSEEKQRKYTTI